MTDPVEPTRPEKKSFAEILGPVTPNASRPFGYRSGSWFFLYAAPFFVVAIALAFFLAALSGGDSRGQGPPWAMVVTLVVWAPFAAYWTGWKLGVHVRVEQRTLILRAPYRRRIVDLDTVTVAAARYPWLGLATLGLTDGSAFTMWLGAPGWGEFLQALDHAQGTKGLDVGGIHKWADRMSFAAFGAGYYTN